MAALLVGLLAAGFSVAGPAQAVADKDCGDFASRRAAQIFYLKHGGPQSDPHRLDSDHDGIACEDNPCPCYYGTKVPGSGGASTAPKASSIILRTSRSSGIAGERLRLTAKVKPAVARRVVLQRRTGGAWKVLTRGRTTKRGVFAFRTKVALKTTSYRAVAPRTTSGSPRFKAAASTAKRVETLRQTVKLASPGLVEQGHFFTVKATVGPVRAGRKVELWRRLVGTGWTRVGTGKENSRGKVSFRVKASTLGRHDYRAHLLDHAGAVGYWSVYRSVTVKDTVAPPRPTGVQAVPGDHAVTVSWDAVTAGDLQGYDVYAGAPLAVVATVGPGQTSYTVTGLEPGTAYDFAVVAFDEVDNRSALSATVTAVPLDLTPPAVPTDLVAAPGESSFDAAWTPSPDGDVDHYIVRYQESGATDWLTLTTGVPSATVTGLLPGTAYAVEVAAVDTAGNQSAWSAGVVVVTLSPST